MKPVYLVIGLGVAGLIVSGLWVGNKSSHMELEGEIKLVRTYAIDERSSFAILDLRLKNPAKYGYVVRKADLLLDRPGIKPEEAMVITEMDARRIFQQLPGLGPKYNDHIMLKERYPSGGTVDKMIVGKFELPEAELEKRVRFRVILEEADGVLTEISEKRGR